MRAIRKLPEPRSLTQYRAGIDTSYENAYDEFPHKKVLRDQLLEEQRGLCAFCGCRIVNDPLNMKIAHWKPRKLKVEDANGMETFPNMPDQLAYWNMLGVCYGNEGHPVKDQHCDTHQGNLPLSKNPAGPQHHIDDIVSFLADGSIVSSDTQFNTELGCKRADGCFDEGVLNLNLAFIRNNRRAALDGFQSGIVTRGELDKDQIRRLLPKWRGDNPGDLPPYSPVVAYWLKKRLARLEL